VKAFVQSLIERAGYRVFRERPRDLANPLPVELAAHRALLRALLEDLSVTTVLDVGAHTGGYGALLRELGYAREIVSFEPVAASFAVLAGRLDGSWRAQRLALGRAPGVLRLNVARESNFTSAFPANAFAGEHFGGSAVERVEEVEVARLDVVASGERILFKTDTQGYDLEVIAGASGLLDRVVAMQVELSVTPLYSGAPDWLVVLAELRELGFVPVSLTGVGRAGLAAVEFDCLLVRERAR
jgi:FkbM family methyltransferase